jgi:hypothetical protein
LVALTRSSKPALNLRAWGAVLAGLLSTAALPVAVVVEERSESIGLLDTAVVIPFALLVGIAAIMLGSRASRRSAFTLGRVGGGTTGGIGRWLGVVGVYIALTAALAVGFYGVLTLLD